MLNAYRFYLVAEVLNADSCSVCSQDWLHYSFGYGVEGCQWTYSDCTIFSGFHQDRSVVYSCSNDRDGRDEAVGTPARSSVTPLNRPYPENLLTTCLLWQICDRRFSSSLACVYSNDCGARPPIDPWPASINPHPSEQEQRLDGRLHY